MLPLPITRDISKRKKTVKRQKFLFKEMFGEVAVKMA